jgi:hypothetical protein
MPVVEENRGFVACPPPFTAKGVRFDARIRSCGNVGRQETVRQIKLLYNLAHVLDCAWLH